TCRVNFSGPVPWDLVFALRRRDSGVLIERAELNPDQAEKVVTAMANSLVLFELETVELMDLPTIELKDGETYKESRSLSTGQKCTMVLPLLLRESANQPRSSSRSTRIATKSRSIPQPGRPDRWLSSSRYYDSKGL
ncbi:MAG: hypothetical protein ACKO8U_19660, partial [Pirellula sp.]